MDGEIRKLNRRVQKLRDQQRVMARILKFLLRRVVRDGSARRRILNWIKDM